MNNAHINIKNHVLVNINCQYEVYLHINMINANQSMSMQVNSKFKPLTITDEPSRKVLWWAKRLPDDGYR